MDILLFLSGVFTFLAVLVVIIDKVPFKIKVILLLSVFVLNQFVQPILTNRIFS